MRNGLERIASLGLAAGVMAGMFAPGALAAQASPLMQLGKSELNGALKSRYDTAVSATDDATLRAAQDSRWTWAVEAKNQCGIAIGFMKSGTKDADSINKCDDFVARLSAAPPPPVPDAASAPPALDCTAPAVSIFFDWNMDTPLPEGAATIGQITQSAAQCGWKRFGVTGYTDTSGGTRYNDGLSMRRAQNVAGLMSQSGVPMDAMSVSGLGETQLKIETADNVREPMNRRVEVTVSAN
ncbi:OmpA family protein [Sphingobium vermicomposti]|uniref:Outer membrane protein OmpA-like peptidoglycan-associated protein n=1 Tax=Sphingobium vermicomposti TaxID=529005 RepID=A0A846M5Z5_9SPHN|nr:OmpA family protein [Sphingobium vermicomposti]NIJ16933.1 outer membrane protein OmpA-like peptidoglycan-associated protein [Sphingobium vermicomposti]